jgi:ribosome-binding protein aMBF1 (putative translation factor)
MNTKQLNSTEEIRNEFQKLFEKSPEEQVEHRAQLLSYIFLSEAQKAMDRKGWTRKQLADEIGTSASYLTQLFRGDRLLNFKTVAKIEGALDVRFQINVTESEEGSINYLPNQDIDWEEAQVNEPE